MMLKAHLLQLFRLCTSWGRYCGELAIKEDAEKILERL